jgi:branched-chain amino acid transport system permease protein
VLFTACYVAMAAGWNILGGFTGYISLGHNVFFAIGGYFAGHDHGPLRHLDDHARAARRARGGIFGYLIGLITLRVRGPSFIISSLALVMIFRILFDNWHFVGGPTGVSLPANDLPRAVGQAALLLRLRADGGLRGLGSYRIKHSKFGLGLRAISKDEIKAESAGHRHATSTRSLAFAISAFFVGMAGVRRAAALRRQQHPLHDGDQDRRMGARQARRFALLARGKEPILWDFGSAAVHHKLYSPWLEPENCRAGLSACAAPCRRPSA